MRQSGTREEFEETLAKLPLRERKKILTRRKLIRVAVELFLERGYDQVSVAEIAAAADVSKMTVFNYFGTKDDILLSPMEEHIGDAAKAVCERAPGETPLAALHRDFLERVAALDASVGMSDEPIVLKLRSLIEETPVLLSRALVFRRRSTALLAAALAEETGDPVTARLVAAQLGAVGDAISEENRRLLLEGRPLDEVAANAVQVAGRAFALVEHGLAGYAVKEAKGEKEAKEAKGEKEAAAS
ncbi:helix-turn-helix domain-containing protein [Streptomyces sp. NPDC050738]|uniref:TetR/AcrR family transcriptional regulator n=1 Tax=Streptomyces sp. NPDC050738 TaxID=3154744 RepID=UPI0034402225